MDFVRGKTYIQGDKALPTYLVLIPLIYVRYHFEDEWKTATGKDTYVLRCSMSGAFGGGSDNLLDALVAKLKEIKGFDADAMFNVIRTQGRSLEVTEDRLWQMGYGSDSVHLLFNLWYRQFDYVPAYENNKPQVDHIFPQSVLRKIKTENPRTGRKDLMKYRDADRNQLANCMLLTREENGAGGKWDTPPDQWFNGKPTGYLDMHLIPKDRSLWDVNRFDDFIAALKELLRQKFADWIVQQKIAAS